MNRSEVIEKLKSDIINITFTKVDGHQVLCHGNG